MKKLTKWATLFLLLSLVLLISGCGESANEFIAKNYSLEDVQGNEKEGLQKVYRAANMSVAQVIEKIASQQQPKEKSEVKEGKAVLVYDNYVVTVKKDDNKDQDSLIYVSSYQFVRNNTDSGFWQGYITARLLDVLFDGIGMRAPPYYPGGSYKGPWDYSGGSKDSSDHSLKKPDSVAKPSTSQGTGAVTRKSPDSSSNGSVSVDNSDHSSGGSSKSGGFISPSSKPKTSGGTGTVTRRSGKR